MKHKKTLKPKEPFKSGLEEIQYNSITVETIGFKQRNKENKRTSRRGFIMESSLGTPSTHNAIQIGRNEPCHCGSGKKFKKCHLVKQIIQKQ